MKLICCFYVATVFCSCGIKSYVTRGGVYWNTLTLYTHKYVTLHLIVNLRTHLFMRVFDQLQCDPECTVSPQYHFNVFSDTDSIGSLYKKKN